LDYLKRDKMIIKKTKVKALLLFLFFLIHGICSAQQLHVEAGFDTNSAIIGNPFVFKVSSEFSKDILLEMPLFSEELNKNIEIVGAPDFDSVETEAGKLRIIHKYEVVVWDSGTYSIDSVPFSFQSGEFIDTLYSIPSTVYVGFMDIDTTGTVRDIKPLMKAPVLFKEVIPWILVFLGVGILALVVWFFLFKTKEERKQVFAKPALPPHVKALNGLDELAEKKLWQAGELKEYWARVSEILRTYLKERYGFNALEILTGEVISYSTRFIGDEGVVESIKFILVNSDMVKFAKFETTPEENELAIEKAYSVILKTKPSVLDEEGNNQVEDADNV
jgi:hypothetical protein